MFDRVFSSLSGLFSPEIWVSIALIVILLVAFVLLRVSFNRYIKGVEASEKTHYATRVRVARTIYTVIRYVLLAVVVMAVLEINGIDITALAAAAGVAGIILGFALQDILSDLAMGVRIVTDNYFHVGQVVRAGDIEGTVESISPQSTRIRDIRNNSVHTVSNRLLTKVEVLDTMVDLDVPLSYELSMGQVQQIMDDVVAAVKIVEDVQEAAFKGTQSFEQSSVLYRLRIWCPQATRYQVLRDARCRVQEVLERHGQAIPYPQLDVHNR